jgi:hypothetical protein
VGLLARLCPSSRPGCRPDPAKDEADRSASGTAHDVPTHDTGATAPSRQARWRWVATTGICFPWRRHHLAAAPHKLKPGRLHDEADRVLGAAERLLGSRSPPPRSGWYAVEARPLSDASHNRVGRRTEQ